MNKSSRKERVDVVGPWIAVSIKFLRSIARARLSPHATKLLVDVLSMLKPNGHGNGDISLTPSLMKPRGWTSRATLNAAIQELRDAQLLFQTKQGHRLGTSLWALTLYPIACDFKKLDINHGMHSPDSYAGTEGGLSHPVSKETPVRWNKLPRK
jgi:hypothetical protein